MQEIRDNEDFQSRIDQQVKVQEQLREIEIVVKQYLSKEAVTRYGSLKVAHPEKALSVINILLNLVQQGKLKEKLNDEEFKQLLQEMDKR